MVRIGWGYDIHRLFTGRLTVLGGVALPDFDKGFDTHSESYAEVVNLDCTIFCAAPRVGPAAPKMRSNIAAGLACDVDLVSVKGKTNDGFGPEGQGHAISATVLIQLRTKDIGG